MNYRIRVDFIITHFDEDPASITETLSLSPSQSWLKGESIGGSTVRRKHNGWLLSSGLNDRAELDEHLSALFAQLDPALARIALLPASVSRELACAIYIYHGPADSAEEHSTPTINLTPEQLAMLARLGAGFDLDLYVLPEN